MAEFLDTHADSMKEDIIFQQLGNNLLKLARQKAATNGAEFSNTEPTADSIKDDLIIWRRNRTEAQDGNQVYVADRALWMKFLELTDKIRY
ncbi:uncharacterized protein I206_105584 [Kwoniella pini CBS 10737]|uniref:Uncharacterized protein n=1 Tax=Kwoniella pini CBS 10737 TaxID=1296096 RepID=A0AAJ8MPZ7_9TREE